MVGATIAIASHQFNLQVVKRIKVARVALREAGRKPMLRSAISPIGVTLKKHWVIQTRWPGALLEMRKDLFDDRRSSDSVQATAVASISIMMLGS